MSRYADVPVDALPQDIRKRIYQDRGKFGSGVSFTNVRVGVYVGVRVIQSIFEFYLKESGMKVIYEKYMY